MFHGSIVALITPMDESGQVDKEALARLLDMHIKAGTDAILVMGTTGEPATLTHKEKLDIIKFVKQYIKGRVPVIAGTGTHCTQTTLEMTKQAMQVGVDACLLVTPYYNKPTQEGLYQHYKIIAAKVPIPIILYNVPGRTGCDLLPETVNRLAKIANIIGIKEATGQLERAQIILKHCHGQLDIYSGDDKTALGLLLSGAKGVISVTANVAPKLMHEMCAAALAADVAKARAINEQLLSLHERLFVESNPIPTKWALTHMGIIKPGIRLPLTPLSEKYHQQVIDALREAELIT